MYFFVNIFLGHLTKLELTYVRYQEIIFNLISIYL